MIGILTVCQYVCLSVCTVMDFSAAEKCRSVKFCTRVRLLSAMSFSHFGELWLAGSHGGGISPGMYAAICLAPGACTRTHRWGFGIGCRGWVGQSELGAAALRVVGFASCKPADALVTSSLTQRV